MFAEIEKYVENLQAEMDKIPSDRKEELQELSTFISQEMKAGKPVKLTFICTHNSRRSHLGQIWAGVMARYFGYSQIETYSGGTEATAMNPRTVSALERVGFKIQNPGGSNPKYLVRFSESASPMTCFSKKYSDPVNPQKGFAAIMTCSDADAACPVVDGAVFRLALPYEDPKKADNTPAEAQRYDERCRQIAAEMKFVFSQLGKKKS